MSVVDLQALASCLADKEPEAYSCDRCKKDTELGAFGNALGAFGKVVASVQ